MPPHTPIAQCTFGATKDSGASASFGTRPLIEWLRGPIVIVDVENFSLHRIFKFSSSCSVTAEITSLDFSIVGILLCVLNVVRARLRNQTTFA